MVIKKKSTNIYEIEKKGKMNVPGIVFASESLFEKIKRDKTLEQVKNVAMLPDNDLFFALSLLRKDIKPKALKSV